MMFFKSFSNDVLFFLTTSLILDSSDFLSSSRTTMIFVDHIQIPTDARH